MSTFEKLLTLQYKVMHNIPIDVVYTGVVNNHIDADAYDRITGEKFILKADDK